MEQTVPAWAVAAPGGYCTGSIPGKERSSGEGTTEARRRRGRL